MGHRVRIQLDLQGGYLDTIYKQLRQFRYVNGMELLSQFAQGLYNRDP